MIDRAYDNARTMALALFDQSYESGTEFSSALETSIGTVLAMPPFAGVDRRILTDDLREAVATAMDAPSLLLGDEEHHDWLPGRRDAISWRHWRRYDDYLRKVRKLPPPVVDRLDKVTDDILGYLGDPSSREPFDRRGMVVGNVQSGKTTNYAALVNKALDAGYKLIVVLAGMHNNLRSQTQERLDEEVLGIDTARSELTADTLTRFGVGLMPYHPFFFPPTFTSSAPNGDFRVSTARAVGIPIDGRRELVLVVKKNGTVLRTLLRYVRDANPHALADPSGRKRVAGVPLLLIDDEADQASINTRDITDEDGNILDDYKATVINGLIRELLHSFDQSSYIGYTATPFANIFIHHEDTKHPVYGEDLFPRSFVYTLHPPSNYIGPGQLLGIGDQGAEQPIFRPVQDADGLAPPRHKKDHRPDGLPPSLREALRAFLLSSAARRARGHRNEHHSMLVHVTRFNAVQRRVHELVEDELLELRRILTHGDGNAPTRLREELRALWERDFVPTSRAMGCEAPAWEAVSRELRGVAQSADVRSINGESADILDYRTRRATGITTIVIGGDKLSRGLTLDGLTVSYFLRASKMYDTLMQMGRWFGYRPGYEDLCRIYLTPELKTWFRHIAEADEELRSEFEYMSSTGRTPKQYGLRVQSHTVLTVTSPLKMRNAEELHLSFEGTVSETVRLHTDPATLESNFGAVDRFIRGLGPGTVHSEGTGTRIWHGVDSLKVIELLGGYRTHAANTKFRADKAREYIEQQNEKAGELVRWTIALVGKRPTGDDDDEEPDEIGHREVEVGGVPIACLSRGVDELPGDDSFTIRRLLSPVHERLDLDDNARRRALECTREAARKRKSATEPRVASGPCLRAQRPATHGLLLLYPLLPSPKKTSSVTVEQLRDLRTGAYPPVGIGISWPKSSSSVTVPYMVTPLFLEQEA